MGNKNKKPGQARKQNKQRAQDKGLYASSEVQCSLNTAQRRANARLKELGRGAIGAGNSIQPMPKLIECRNEKVIQGNTNALIILGQNRIGSCQNPISFGGYGSTHAGEIRLVAGLGGHAGRAACVPLEGNPNLNGDAATVVISQKTAIDENLQFPQIQGVGRGLFGIPTTLRGQPYFTRFYPRSAVGINADGVRLKAREGIKIWAGAGGYNSLGNKITETAYGIDLIWGDGVGMQPLVKGTNLSNCLLEMADRIDSLIGIVDGFLHTQFTMNMLSIGHFHNSPFFAVPTALAPGLAVGGPVALLQQILHVKKGAYFQKMNLAMFRAKYLIKKDDPNYILSNHNNTN